jgi:hypothetical protein
VFTELLPGNALVRSVTIFIISPPVFALKAEEYQEELQPDP